MCPDCVTYVLFTYKHCVRRGRTSPRHGTFCFFVVRLVSKPLPSPVAIIVQFRGVGASV